MAAIFRRDISVSEEAGNFGKCSSWKLSATNGSIENPRYSPAAESAAGSPTRAGRVAMPLGLPARQRSSRNSRCSTGGRDSTRKELSYEMRQKLGSRVGARLESRK